MFEKIPAKLNFPALEHKILHFWEENNVLEKYLHRNDKAAKRFSFLDGPITANNPMGVHHAWGRTLKDLYQRFWNMRGFKERFQNGFDNQGLWVEVEVEKKLGFENKKDIEKYGIARFVEKCKEHTRHFAEVQTEQSKRLGYFMDWGNDYYTMSDENNYAIWHFLKKVWEDGNLYQGRDSVPWCPRCGTAISQHEILTEEYQELTHDSVFFKLPLTRDAVASSKPCTPRGAAVSSRSQAGQGPAATKENAPFKNVAAPPWGAQKGRGLTAAPQQGARQESATTSTKELGYSQADKLTGCQAVKLLIWTTTPWTIPGNMAVAVDPKLDYWLWQTGEGECLIFADPNQAIEGSGGACPAATVGSFESESSNVQTLNALDIIKEGEKLAVIKGEDLVGLSYLAPYGHLPAAKEVSGENKYKVVAADPMILTVDPSQGTGLVHVAPGCGSEDFELGKKLDIPALPVIDEEANYLEGFGELTGKNAKEHPELVLDDLARECSRTPLACSEEAPQGGAATGTGGIFFHKIVPYTHRYPTCWRCKSELVWRVVDEWYIAMDDERKEGARDYRRELKDIIKDVEWIPEFGYKRELDWLNNMEDWLISKKRYWGLCLPIWECAECGHFEVIGSREELKERAARGWEDFEGHTPHRPYVDAVKIKCPKCGGAMNRIPDVGNPWLDAGIVAYSTLKYFEDKDYWERWFPADLVLECFPGQFKNWFYSLLAMSTVLENRAPFKTLLGHALVKDEHGEEMHKSKGNAIWFDDAAEKMGVDAMRWLYARQDPTHDLHFGYGPAREVKRQFLFILWNSFKFFVTYVRLDNFNPNEAMKLPAGGAQPRENRPDKSGRVEESAGRGGSATCFTLDTFNLTVLDRWVLSRFNETIKEVTNYLESYENHKAAEALEDFVVNDLSTWYIRRIRDRVGPTTPDGEDKTNAYRTMYIVLLNLTKVLAPFIPFMTEEMYQVLTEPAKEKSQLRETAAGKTRRVKTDKPDGLRNAAVEELAGSLESVHLTNWPEYHDYLTDEDVLENMKLVREICEKGHAARRAAGIKVRQPLKKLKVKSDTAAGEPQPRETAAGKTRRVKTDKPDGLRNAAVEELAGLRNAAAEKENQYLQIIKDELNIKEIEFDESRGELEVELDTEITEELRLEGVVREMIRNIQNARKKAGCEWDDKIIATYPDNEDNNAAVASYKDYIKQRTLSTELCSGEEYEVEVA